MRPGDARDVVALPVGRVLQGMLEIGGHDAASAKDWPGYSAAWRPGVANAHHAETPAGVAARRGPKGGKATRHPGEGQARGTCGRAPPRTIAPPSGQRPE